jgi:hypothetical protein
VGEAIGLDEDAFMDLAATVVEEVDLAEDLDQVRKG